MWRSLNRSCSQLFAVYRRPSYNKLIVGSIEMSDSSCSIFPRDRYATPAYRSSEMIGRVFLHNPAQFPNRTLPDSVAAGARNEIGVQNHRLRMLSASDPMPTNLLCRRSRDNSSRIGARGRRIPRTRRGRKPADMAGARGADIIIPDRAREPGRFLTARDRVFPALMEKRKRLGRRRKKQEIVIARSIITARDASILRRSAIRSRAERDRSPITRPDFC